MYEKLMSRRKFLVGAGTVVGAASVSGLVLAERPSTAQAAVTGVPWPWPTDPAAQPVPETLARRAFEVYFASGCAEGSWWPFVEALAPANPDTWGTLPTNMFRFGGGGVGGWGTICGTLNGTSAIIGMTVGNGTHRNNLISAIMEYYAKTSLPTNAAFKSNSGVLGLTTPWDPAAPAAAPLENVPTSTADSPLCHSSLVQWTMTTGAANGGPLQKDRCAKACFDIVFKTTELLNAFFQSGSSPAEALDPSVYACRTCHVTYTGAKMACGSCHDNTIDHYAGD